MQLGFEPIDDFVVKHIDSAPIIEEIIRGTSISQFPEPVRKILLKKYDFEYEDKIFATEKEFDWSEIRYVAFKTRVHLEQQRTLFIDLLARTNPVVIFLCRRNKIKNAISQYKRTQMKISHLGGFHDTSSKRKPITVDPSYILSQATQFVGRELVAKSYFECLKKMSSSAHYEIFYEDLLSAEWRTHFFSGLFNELGLENTPLQSNYLKMTPDSLQHALVNFTELAAFLKTTAFEPSLEDDSYDIVNALYTQELKLPEIQVESIISRVQSMFQPA